MKRELDIVIISDTHLGTYGCHAAELLNYLRGLNFEALFLFFLAEGNGSDLGYRESTPQFELQQE